MAELSENTKFNVNVKTIIAICAGLLSVAAVYFTLIAEIQQMRVDIMRMESEQEMNSEFRIKWPRGEMGTLPADSEQYMLSEDLYGSVEKLEKHIDSMMNNKINIEFLQKQVEKLLTDVEKLKDSNRSIIYSNGNGKTE